MWVEQSLWVPKSGWSITKKNDKGAEASLALVFGAPEMLREAARFDEIKARYPKSLIAIGTTGGEIHGREVCDGSISVTALGFDSVTVDGASVSIASVPDIFMAGAQLGQALAHPDLKSIFVLSDGIKVNGSDLIRGLQRAVGEHIVITGGLAGDGARFSETLVGLNAIPQPGNIAAIGFYGDALRLGHGSAGGWDVFGPERRITRSEHNMLFELDGKPALSLYKRYLGEHAKDLPGSALLFPLRVYQADNEKGAVVRTIVGVDEERQAMIFAGDVPQDYRAQLMKGNFDSLIDGAAEAAQLADAEIKGERAAILVSCIGRKLLLGQRIAEEVEVIGDLLGPNTAVAGFYSYGEISPHSESHFCELHNQTMTVTVLGEA